MSKQKTVPVSELLCQLYKDVPVHVAYADLLQAKVSAAISVARVERGMNQREFAKFMGVTQSQISKWENGDFNFTISKLSEIAHKLDLNLSIDFSSKRPEPTFEATNIINFSDHFGKADRYRADSIDLSLQEG